MEVFAVVEEIDDAGLIYMNNAKSKIQSAKQFLIYAHQYLLTNEKRREFEELIIQLDYINQQLDIQEEKIE